MRRIVLGLVIWSLSACSAVTISVRGEATVPMAYTRPSFAVTGNGAQIVGKTNETGPGQAVTNIALSIRNSTPDHLMEVDWREMTLLAEDGTTHLVRPSTPIPRSGEVQGAITIPPMQTAKLDVAPADSDIRVRPPLKSRAGTVVTVGTLLVPVRSGGKLETAQVPVTFTTEADVPPTARPRLSFAYSTRIAFEPGLGGLLGTTCFLTASYFGGLCWLYLIFPTQGQKDRALQEAQESLKQQYGEGATIVATDIQQVGW